MKVDQHDEGGHIGLGYLFWYGILEKDEVMGARHNSHPTYLAHFGIGFQVFEHIELNMVEEKVVMLGFSRETLKPFPTSST